VYNLPDGDRNGNKPTHWDRPIRPTPLFDHRVHTLDNTPARLYKSLKNAALSSSGLGRGPLKAKTRVQIPIGSFNTQESVGKEHLIAAPHGWVPLSGVSLSGCWLFHRAWWLHTRIAQSSQHVRVRVVPDEAN
jgi:hypothetical protein